MEKVYWMNSLFLVWCMLFVTTACAMEAVVYPNYIKYDGRSLFLIDTPNGIHILSKEYNVDCSNAQAKILSVNGEHLLTLDQENVWAIAACKSVEEIYYFVSSKKNLIIFDRAGNAIGQRSFDREILTITPFLSDNEVHVLVTCNGASYICGIKQDDEIFYLKNQNFITACAGVNTPWGYRLITGSRNYDQDGFLRVWDSKANPVCQIDSMSWLHSIPYTIKHMLPENITDLFSRALNSNIERNYAQDMVIAVAATQVDDESAYVVTASKNGVHILEIKKNWVNFVETITHHENTVVKCVEVLNVEGQVVFITASDKTIKLWNVKGTLLTEIKPQLALSENIQALAALYKNGQIYVVAQTSDPTSDTMHVWTLQQLVRQLISWGGTQWKLISDWSVTSKSSWKLNDFVDDTL